MRKIKLLCVLFACIFIVSGCAANDLPITRKTNSKDDVIKFYGFEWMTEKSVIDKKLKEDFGTDHISNEAEFTLPINDELEFTKVIYQGKNNTDLDWSIAGHKVSTLILLYIKNKSNKSYLYGALWYFNDCNKEDFEDIIKKLDDLYKNTKKEDKEDIRISYIDNNKNTIKVSYSEGSRMIYLDYYCKEIIGITDDMNMEYLLSQKESNNGL